jgi:lysylphosphatidylglycerol synthetase-like protein (DUF2156 family)
MENLKAFFKDKSYGFYASVVVFVMSLITAIVYAANYGGTKEMSWAAFIIILVGLVAAVVLGVFGRYRWIPVAMAVADFVALLLFIKAVYFYVSVVLYGINGSAFSPQFTTSTVFLIITFVLSIANIFLKQVKDEEA